MAHMPLGLVQQIHRERDAEIIRLRAKVEELIGKNSEQLAMVQRQRVELEMLRPLLVDGAPPVQQWPTPQPIETAPLGQLMAWPADADEEGGPTWSHEWPQEGETLETWREALKQFGLTHWLPMPPPPGGVK